jgi:hypothetical protein
VTTDAVAPARLDTATQCARSSTERDHPMMSHDLVEGGPTSSVTAGCTHRCEVESLQRMTALLLVVIVVDVVWPAVRDSTPRVDRTGHRERTTRRKGGSVAP